VLGEECISTVKVVRYGQCRRRLVGRLASLVVEFSLSGRWRPARALVRGIEMGGTAVKGQSHLVGAL
jgi:hypothetical protein